jgi:hypothetical protein
MEALLIYLTKVNLVISVLFLVYFLLLRNETFFKVNRIFLLGTMIFSLVLPFLPVFDFAQIPSFQQPIAAINPFYGLYGAAAGASLPLLSHIDPKVVSSGPTLSHFISGLTLVQISVGIYLFITCILLGRYVIQFGRLLILLQKSKALLTDADITLVDQKELPPFSFFGYLIINRARYSSDQYRQIIAHENAHMRGWHTIDMLLAELLHVFFWINPLVSGLKKAVQLNLEYIADDCVLQNGFDRKNYQLTLVNCVNPSAPPLVNLFNSSKLKHRIKMMNSRPSPSRYLYKYALVIPAVLFCYLVIHPLEARTSIRLIPKIKTDGGWIPKQLNSFGGYYRSRSNRRIFLHVGSKDGALDIEQLWNHKSFSAEPKEKMYFFDQIHKISLQFSTDRNQIVTQQASGGREVWDKTETFIPFTRTDTTINPQQLKTFEGYYQFQFQQGKDDFIHITATEKGLILRQMWDGVEISFTPQSALEFLNSDGNFPLKFTKDNSGVITEVLAMDKDLWKRAKDYKPLVIKPVPVDQKDLKALEGKYTMRNQDGKDVFIEITAKEKGITLKQDWDGKETQFIPLGALIFVNEFGNFTLKFKKDDSGAITEVLAFGKDVWTRVKG